MAAQQFSLRWNNYSQHIVNALEELRADDELTDVTLSCEGQRVKAHKLLLSACSAFFKETFKENPCKHPVIILKGVSFADLQAVVQFMYNGQVNVSQERLPSFLQTAEILQIKGLTDTANGEREEPKKRPQTFPSQASTPVDSIRQDEARPPTPKRKRMIGNGGTLATAQNSELPGTASVISANSSGVGAGSCSSSHSNSNHSNPPPPLLIARNNSTENSVDDLPVVKFEDHDVDVDEELQYEHTLSEDNDNSFQDNGKELIGGESNSLGSNIRTSGAGERRPRYTLQPSNDHATGVVDATNAGLPRQNRGPVRDLIYDSSSPVVATDRKSGGYTNGNCLKMKSRLNSRSLSSSSAPYLQQDDRVIKYAPLQIHSQDSGSNSSHEGGELHFLEECSESPQGTDEDEDTHLRRSLSLKGRVIGHVVKGNSATQQLSNTHRSNNLMNGNSNNILRGAPTGSIRGATRSGSLPDDLTVSSPTEMTTPSFSLTQQLLQQNVLSLISSNGTEVIKGNLVGGGPANRVSAIAITQSHSNQGGIAEQPLIAPYICDICGKRYVHHRSLNDHKKSHTGATRCPVCNKSFSKVANMRAHYAAQHSSQNEGDSEELQVQQNGHVSVN